MCSLYRPNHGITYSARVCDLASLSRTTPRRGPAGFFVYKDTLSRAGRVRCVWALQRETGNGRSRTHQCCRPRLLAVNSGAGWRGGGIRSGLFSRSLSQGVIDPILPAGPTLLEVFENVLIDPQRNELLHTRKRGLLRRQFRNLCRCLLERGFGFGARIVERPRPSWWL